MTEEAKGTVSNEYVNKAFLELIVNRVQSRINYLSRDVNMFSFVTGAEYALEYFKEYEKFLVKIENGNLQNNIKEL